MRAADEGSPRFHRLKGRLKRAVGWFTADRRVEAEGKVEQRVAAKPSDPAVEHTEHEVKRSYGETLDEHG